MLPCLVPSCPQIMQIGTSFWSRSDLVLELTGLSGLEVSYLVLQVCISFLEFQTKWRTSVFALFAQKCRCSYVVRAEQNSHPVKSSWVMESLPVIIQAQTKLNQSFPPSDEAQHCSASSSFLWGCNDCHCEFLNLKVQIRKHAVLRLVAQCFGVLHWQLKPMSLRLRQKGCSGHSWRTFWLRVLPSNEDPWGRLDCICNSKTIKRVRVSVTFWKFIRKQFKSVSVISRV